MGQQKAEEAVLKKIAAEEPAVAAQATVVAEADENWGKRENQNPLEAEPEWSNDLVEGVHFAE